MTGIRELHIIPFSNSKDAIEQFAILLASMANLETLSLSIYERPEFTRESEDGTAPQPDWDMDLSCYCDYGYDQAGFFMKLSDELDTIGTVLNPQLFSNLRKLYLTDFEFSFSSLYVLLKNRSGTSRRWRSCLITTRNCLLSWSKEDSVLIVQPGVLPFEDVEDMESYFLMDYIVRMILSVTHLCAQY